MRSVSITVQSATPPTASAANSHVHQTVDSIPNTTDSIPNRLRRTPRQRAAHRVSAFRIGSAAHRVSGT